MTMTQKQHTIAGGRVTESQWHTLNAYAKMNRWPMTVATIVALENLRDNENLIDGQHTAKRGTLNALINNINVNDDLYKWLAKTSNKYNLPMTEIVRKAIEILPLTMTKPKQYQLTIYKENSENDEQPRRPII